MALHLQCVNLILFTMSGYLLALTFPQAEPGSTVTPKSRRCLTPEKALGYCIHLSRCPLPEFKKEKLLFMDYFCIIDRIFVGVCCPDKIIAQSNMAQVILGNPSWEGDQHQVNQGLDWTEMTTASTTTKTTTKPVKTKPVPAPPPTAEAPAERKGCGVNHNMQFTRVVGGRPADPKQWPWMVALLKNGDDQFCGGCLFTDRHVLTAAHCVYKFDPRQLTVRLGEHDLSRMDETRAQDFNVTDIRHHKDFDENTYENDIAVLTMGRATLFNSYMWPVCLPQPGEDFVDRSAVVTGWGTVEYGGPASNVLMEVSVPVWNNSLCDAQYVQPILETNLCAGGKSGEDSCQGDSGGPLLLQLENKRWVTIGVVSWGIKCGTARPAVYTRVSKYIDWIIQNAIF